jgi:hypothetical protein
MAVPAKAKLSDCQGRKGLSAVPGQNYLTYKTSDFPVFGGLEKTEIRKV